MSLTSSLLLALVCTTTAADPHPFSVHDMLAMDRISDPRVSPDGKAVAFTLRVTDVQANKGLTDLWVIGVDGSHLRRLTTHEAADSGACWLPDSRSLVFLSTRSGSSQVWQIHIDGGEATRLTDLPLDVDNVLVFPDGKRLLLTLEVYPDLPATNALTETAQRDAAKAATKASGRVFDSLLFRHWDQWEDGKRSHLFVTDLAGGNPRDLLPGFDGDAPIKPFGGREEFAIAPQGDEVAFAAQMMTDDAAWSTDVNIYVVPADGSKPARCITADNKAMDTQPVYSPDGQRLAWLAMRQPQYESDRRRIVVMERSSGATQVLTENWDASPGELAWSTDSTRLFTSADNLGQKSVFSIDAATGAATTLVMAGSNGSVCALPDRVLFLQDTLSAPAELFAQSLAGNNQPPQAITHINDDKVKATAIGSYEQFTFQGAGGEKVYGYLVRPVGFAPGKKYPVAFLIHGGPQGSFGNHFHYRWNPQAYAGRGYAAVMIDFHGSTGYGQAFCDAIRGDWGGQPFEDLMKGLDAALARYDFLDGSRVAALGASFGGYMINWIAGHTDRFRCLVNHDGNLDERMAYFDTEELWFTEWDHQGTPWDNPTGYTRHNPIDFVQHWQTPMLVIHGGKDFRVVETQGFSTFTALKRRGVPARLLYFPDENHWVLKPQNSIQWHATVLDWLDAWTGQR